VFGGVWVFVRNGATSNTFLGFTNTTNWKNRT